MYFGLLLILILFGVSSASIDDDNLVVNGNSLLRNSLFGANPALVQQARPVNTKKLKNPKETKKEPKEKSKDTKKKAPKKTPSGPTKVKKEVCVIGGGAAGAFTAYGVQKSGYDTVLFEPRDNLGGNCEVVEVASKIDPSITYKIAAAVVIYVPTPTTQTFFNEFDIPTEKKKYGIVKNFVYAGPGAVFPAPPADPQVLGAALQAFFTAVNTPPLAGTTDGLSTLPDWENLSSEEVAALLEPFKNFYEGNPGVVPLIPIISQLAQGLGFVDTLPMWEILVTSPPSFISMIFNQMFLTPKDGCQDLYDELENRMIDKDSKSVMLNTVVDNIERKKNKVTLRAVNAESGREENYDCDDAIIAFRPDEINKSTLKDITESEESFFDDLTYNGYVPSVWSMGLGPSLLGVGANISTPLQFISASPVDVGIVTLIKEGTKPDYPWHVFYHPNEPADTPEKLEAVKQEIVLELTGLGFINIENIFIKNHKYGVKPQSTKNTVQWTKFFNEKNSNSDNLFWTGSVPAGDSSHNVWEYSLNLMEDNFPAK